MTFDLAYALSTVPAILLGAWTTLLATACGYAIALLVGLVFLAGALARSRVIRAMAIWTSLLLRGTPLLVQLYFLYYVLPLYGPALSAFATGVIGLGLQYGAYLGEVYRAGVGGVPQGQWESARALALPRLRIWQLVVLPLAIRRVLPPLGNYLIAMFKSTPYLAAITVNEMLGSALDEASQSFRYLEPILVAGALFLAASLGVSYAVRRMTRAMASSPGASAVPRAGVSTPWWRLRAGAGHRRPA